MVVGLDVEWMENWLGILVFRTSLPGASLQNILGVEDAVKPASQLHCHMFLPTTKYEEPVTSP